MEALSSLGINGKMLIAQIINFLILLFLLNRLLYKPLLNLFDQRRQKIEQGLKDAEASSDALKKANDEADQIKEKAYADAGEIIKQAKLEAEKESKAIIADATKQSEKIIQGAGEEARSMKEAARGEIKASIGDLIAMSLTKITSNKIDAATREKLTDEAVKELK